MRSDWTVHIVLVEPEIPANTGNISRTCAATGCVLHLVRPLGFSTDDRHLKRAGLDYWHLLDIRYHDSIEEVWDKHPNGRFFYASTKGKKRYTDVEYQPDDFLVFGKETKGLPEELLRRFPEQVIRIPIRSDARSLNLSNAVAIVVFEALRQVGFPGLI
ncbi:tRNA (uridine(34)/cytosine(34)/5-carboxymethylaminomethyluridine(34)-2'-O)-methyltransferase TrmL [Alicyclobacillus pomorum]|uniref:tRNA (uridine(34)/cytosine(34)/5- carboxymethylaminomethyluridine(34)-2'-O)- methyltransferase TrmL n=1 Tax=Alicyclobacillus pomorum TaxID=204470 RepID=UPI001B7FD638|nr:tRNA (uridine(34)/cytosine(34)/5-carboxymethylaminomethyluridine(34)-2'-O)-methyltransferase TrmL [Alicyclobacillus pomorum]